MKTLTLVWVLVSPHPCQGWGGLESEMEHCDTSSWEQLIEPAALPKTHPCYNMPAPQVIHCWRRQ